MAVINLDESWDREIVDGVGFVKVSVGFWLLDALVSSGFGFGVIAGFNLANSERNFSLIGSMEVLKWADSFLNV